jgi:uncharacterized protein
MKEFPDLDVTGRGAFNWPRLMDPLAELVKIDRSQSGLASTSTTSTRRCSGKNSKKRLKSAVNYVGVDLKHGIEGMLTYVSGITSSIARSIVEWRNSNGAFRCRQDILRCRGSVAKTFEQAQDSCASAAEQMSSTTRRFFPKATPLPKKKYYAISESRWEHSQLARLFDSVNLERYVDGNIGMPT